MQFTTEIEDKKLFMGRFGPRGLARISHQPCAADADMLAVTEYTPCGRFDVVSTTPASTSPPMCLWHIGLCTPSQRHLDALATKAGEKCGLASIVFAVIVFNEHLPGGTITMKVVRTIALSVVGHGCSANPLVAAPVTQIKSS